MTFYYKCFILYIFLCSVKILTNFMLLRLHLKISFYIEKSKKKSFVLLEILLYISNPNNIFINSEDQKNTK